MSDLIDRQAALDAITEYWKSEVDELPEAEFNVVADVRDLDLMRKYNQGVRKVLRAIPSAQPEIIRCRDCKHFAEEGMYCACDIMVHFDHFYCYYAERKQDG